MAGRGIRGFLVLTVILFSLRAEAAIVINEIMYNPPSDDRDATYVELYNTSPTAVNLSGWQFTRGISFTFPAISIQPDDYLVVCRNETRVQELYGTTKTVGDFTGYLSRGGETLELVDDHGVVADRVSYDDRNPWPVRADGNGAAVGLVNPALDNDDGHHWAAEMENNDGWRHIVTRGVFDPVGSVKIFLELSGEALIDDVELVRESQPGVNLISNPGFEGPNTGGDAWAFLGNHSSSAIETGDAHSGTHALHVRATGGGSFGGDYIEKPISVSATSREFFTLSLWAKPLSDTNAITLATGDGRDGTIYEVFRLDRSVPEVIAGSPGRPNFVYKPLPQPFFRSHDREPNYPAAGEPATVTVTVENPSEVAGINLYYAVQNLPLGGTAPDPYDLSFTTLTLTANGSSFTTVIPGQAGGRLVRYYLEMRSNGGETFRRPAENEFPRYYGYYVKPSDLPPHKVPIFYIQVSPEHKALIDRLADDLGDGMFKGYNLAVRADFIDLKSGEYFGDIRTRYRGGVGTRRRKNNYKIFFNDGHRWEGLRVVNVTPNNQGKSQTTLGLANAVVHYMDSLFGVPALNMAQWARVYYNGSDKGLLTMVEQPDRNFLDRYGLSDKGQMFKSIGWRFAYPRIRGDEALFYGPIGDGQDSRKKLRDSIDNPYTIEDYMFAYDQELSNPRGYQDLISFIQTLNDIPNSYPMTTADPDYIALADCVGSKTMLVEMKQFLENSTNVDRILRKFAIDVLGSDWDRVIHNHYWYAGEDGKWWLISWDRDFWSSGYGYDDELFMHVGRWYKSSDPTYPRVLRVDYTGRTGPWPTMTAFMYPPEFRQRYYRIVREALETIVTPYTMKNYIDRELAYVIPEHVIANNRPSLDLNTFQAQQDFISAQRVRIFKYMQTVFDMNPDLLNPVVCDVRHTPSVPAPGQTIEFQANAISSVGTGLCTTVTLMLKGPGDTEFTPHIMTRVADDSGYGGNVPDPNHTYYFRAPGIPDGQVYEYYVVAQDVSGGVRTTVVPGNAPHVTRKVMADGDPTSSAHGIVINEIMYNSDLQANEYIELTNISDRIVDLGGWSVMDSSDKRPFVFENDTTLAPGEFIVVAYNAWRVRQIYGINNVVGDYAFRLGNGGDTIYLYDKNSNLIDTVSYSDSAPWPIVADGDGPSLELIDPSMDNNDPHSYAVDFPPGHRGTPGAPNYALGSSVEEWKRY